MIGDGRVGEGVNSLTKRNHWGCGHSVVPLHYKTDIGNISEERKKRAP